MRMNQLENVIQEEEEEEVEMEAEEGGEGEEGAEGESQGEEEEGEEKEAEQQDSGKSISNRAILHDVMLSSNMAASIATAINFHLRKHLFTLFFVMVSPWTILFMVQGAWWLRARMVHVTALDIQVSLRNPMAMLEDSITSLKILYRSVN